MKFITLICCSFISLVAAQHHSWRRHRPQPTSGWDSWDPPSHEMGSWHQPNHQPPRRSQNRTRVYKNHPFHHHEQWGPIFVPVPYPVPVPVAAPNPPSPPPPPVPVVPSPAVSIAGARGASSTATNSLVPGGGPFSATVTLSGATGSVPIRSSTLSSSSASSGLFQNSPAAQAAAQVVAAAQAAYNAQTAFQAQAADATRAATQAAYAQQAAEAARSVANSLSGGLVSPQLPALPPF